MLVDKENVDVRKGGTNVYNKVSKSNQIVIHRRATK